MATYQQLTDDVLSYLNRRDSLARVPGWVAIVETELSETLRSRCQIKTATQAVDASYISLPPDFGTMAAIRDFATGINLVLKDEWSGSWTDYRQVVAYRLHGDCLEFLPHIVLPDPPDPAWIVPMVEMSWYARPRPLVQPADTNPILENHYAIYLYGVLSHSGVFEQNPEMTQVWDAKYQQAVTRANLWKQQSDFSGAPFTAELSGVF